MVTRVKDFDLSISCTLQCLGCVVIALKPEQRAFVKKGKDVVWLVLASHCQLYMYMQSFPSRLLIVDATCMKGLIATQCGWQTLLPNTNVGTFVIS